jgi:rhodanese-related sulfurtransferase
MTSPPPVRSLDREALQGLLEAAEVSLVEASSFAFYADAHLPGAVNLPCDQVGELAGRRLPDRSQPVVVYAGGPTSSNAQIVARRLLEQGYRDVAVYQGGKQDWVEAGLPVVRGTAAGPSATAAGHGVTATSQGGNSARGERD